MQRPTLIIAVFPHADRLVVGMLHPGNESGDPNRATTGQLPAGTGCTRARHRAYRGSVLTGVRYARQYPGGSRHHATIVALVALVTIRN